jgi:hypothetical protein
VRLTPGEIAHCIASTKLPAAEWATAVAVALAESGGETDALGVNDKGAVPNPAPVTWGSYDCGLWQVNNYWHAAKMVGLNWRDPYANAELAYRAWLEGKSTWRPWSTFNSGAHVRFMPHAAIGVAHPFPVRPFPSVAVSVPAPVVNVTTQQVDLSGLEAQVAEVRSKFA